MNAKRRQSRGSAKARSIRLPTPNDSSLQYPQLIPTIASRGRLGLIPSGRRETM